MRAVMRQNSLSMNDINHLSGYRIRLRMVRFEFKLLILHPLFKSIHYHI